MMVTGKKQARAMRNMLAVKLVGKIAMAMGIQAVAGMGPIKRKKGDAQ
jgi:hypothetical protein